MRVVKDVLMFMFCLDNNEKLELQVVDISTSVWSVPPPLLIF